MIMIIIIIILFLIVSHGSKHILVGMCYVELWKILVLNMDFCLIGTHFFIVEFLL